MQKKAFNSEIFIYPTLLILLLWVIYWGEFNTPIDLVSLGIMPRTLGGLSGVFFSPLLHSTNDIYHLINNTFPIFILGVAILFYYRKIAFQVFFLSWLISGILTWFIAKNEGSYHIGISSVIYALICFLFLSGVLRRQKQLQAVSLLIVLLYGSLVWGIFPVEEKISWQGHLGGSIAGIFLAIYFYESPIKQGKTEVKVDLKITKVTHKRINDLNKQYLENSSSKHIFDYTISKQD